MVLVINPPGIYQGLPTGIYQGLPKSIPDTLFSPTSEPDVDRVLHAVALMHVPRKAARSHNMQNIIQKLEIISG